jgi:ribosomal protein S18 acetylase RimI-like enzyme
MAPDPAVRRAGPDDAATAGRLMYDFNTEFESPTPDADRLAARFERLLRDDDLVVLFVGEKPDGLAVLRFRPNLYSDARECYLAELYVVPERRGRGLGRALLDAVLDTARAAGADRIELGTSEDDVAARALYERFGFTNREGPGGPIMYVYEREL